MTEVIVKGRKKFLSLTRTCFQIADFGLSSLYRRDEYLQTYCGSPLYASPEIVNGRPYKGPEVDSWSLGVLLYALVHEAMPFDGHDYRTLVRQISTGDYRKPTKPSGTSSLCVSMSRASRLDTLLSDNKKEVHIISKVNLPSSQWNAKTTI